MSDETVGLPEDPADFNLMEWITSGTVARREVPVYNRPDLLAEYAQIEERLKDAGWTLTDAGWTDRPGKPDASAKDGPLSESDDDPQVATDLERWPALEDELLAARAVWSVRALGKDDMEWVESQLEELVPPIPLPPSASDGARTKYEARVNRYNRRRNEQIRERAILIVSRGVESIATPTTTATGVSVASLTALDHTPHGTKIIDLIYTAIEQATGADVEIPRPTSPGSSTGTRA